MGEEGSRPDVSGLPCPDGPTDLVDPSVVGPTVQIDDGPGPAENDRGRPLPKTLGPRNTELTRCREYVSGVDRVNTRTRARWGIGGK